MINLAQFQEELRKYILANTNITMPVVIEEIASDEEIDECVTIIATGGLSPSKAINMRQPTIQILVESESTKKARETIEDIFSLLHQKYNLDMGTYNVAQVDSIQEPFYLGRDDNGRSLYSVNFLFLLI